MRTLPVELLLWQLHKTFIFGGFAVVLAPLPLLSSSHNEPSKSIQGTMRLVGNVSREDRKT